MGKTVSNWNFNRKSVDYCHGWRFRSLAGVTERLQWGVYASTNSQTNEWEKRLSLGAIDKWIDFNAWLTRWLPVCDAKSNAIDTRHWSGTKFLASPTMARWFGCFSFSWKVDTQPTIDIRHRHRLNYSESINEMVQKLHLIHSNNEINWTIWWLAIPTTPGSARAPTTTNSETHLHTYKLS